MTTYLFITGKSQGLSLAEITSVLNRDALVFDIKSITRMYALINIAAEDKIVRSIHEKLGGTIKIARILSEISPDAIIPYCTELFGYEKKVRLGISSYIHTSGSQVNQLGSQIKRALKDTTAIRHIPCGNEPILNAVSVIKNNLATTHWEIILAPGSHTGSAYIARTIAVQNIHAYSLRDYRKPGRDAKRGMLPPKLAQIMINIIPDKPTQIHDAFCGSGTLVIEGLLMDHQMSGSDIDPAAIDIARQNIEFVTRKLKHSANQATLTTQDALSLDTRGFPQNTWIVSEVDLGTPKRMLSNEVSREIRELKDKYVSFLRHIARSDTISGLVLALPFFQDKNQRFMLPIIDDITDLGYTIINPLRLVSYQDQMNMTDYDPDRGTLLYSRPDQHTGREIIILKRKHGGRHGT